MYLNSVISRKPFLPEKEALAQGEYTVILQKMNYRSTWGPTPWEAQSASYNATSPAKETGS